MSAYSTVEFTCSPSTGRGSAGQFLSCESDIVVSMSGAQLWCTVVVHGCGAQAGILDFGDMLKSWLVNDVAVRGKFHPRGIRNCTPLGEFSVLLCVLGFVKTSTCTNLKQSVPLPQAQSHIYNDTSCSVWERVVIVTKCFCLCENLFQDIDIERCGGMSVVDCNGVCHPGEG